MRRYLRWRFRIWLVTLSCERRFSFFALSGHGDDLQTPLHIVGDGGEEDLNACFSKPSPSHPAKAVASFPGPEDRLDPATDTVDSVGSRPPAVPVFRLRPVPTCRWPRCVAFHPWRAPRGRNDCRDRRRCRQTPRQDCRAEHQGQPCHRLRWLELRQSPRQGPASAPTWALNREAIAHIAATAKMFGPCHNSRRKPLRPHQYRS